MLAHMNQEDCGLGLKDIIEKISETVLLTWQDFPTGPAMKAYKYERYVFFEFYDLIH